MSGEQTTPYRSHAVAGTDVIHGVLEVGGLLPSRVPAYRSTHPQLQLCFRLHQPAQRERHRSNGQTFGVGESKRTPGAVPQLCIQRRHIQGECPGRDGVIGVGDLEPEPTSGEAARANAAA